MSRRSIYDLCVECGKATVGYRHRCEPCRKAHRASYSKMYTHKKRKPKPPARRPCRTCNEPTHILSTFCRYHYVMYHAATMNVRYHTLKDHGRKPMGSEIEREYQRRVAMPNGNKVGYILKNAQQPDGLRRKVIPPSMIQWSSPEKMVRLIQRKGFVMGSVR